MKFKRIKINNFMRYKGEHEIEFSCDDEKNVTVIMGENTFGKTTLAQAFRWGLYGEIIDTKYGTQRNTILLNKDVLAGLGSIDDASVSVELEIIDEDMSYIFRREAKYARKFPCMTSKLVEEKLWFKSKEKDGRWSDWKDNDSSKSEEKGKAEDTIKLLFPKDLSAYFFFDGEKWSDEKTTNNELKKSISSLMGITPLVKMKEQLLNDRSKCLIRQLKKRISGSSTKFNDIKRQIEEQETLIEKWSKEKEEQEEDYKEFREKVNRAEEILNSNKKIEEEQRRYEQVEKTANKSEEIIKSNYADIIKEFSKDGYKYFAMSMLSDINNILENDKDKKDDVNTIPDITTDTIDYLIENKTCICGNEITEKEIETLNALRNRITGNVNSTTINSYKTVLEMWKNNITDFAKDIAEKAGNIEGTMDELDNEKKEMADLKERIDTKINFKDERRRMEANKRRMTDAFNEIARRERNIESARLRLKGLEQEEKKETANTLENRRIQRMIDYAEALYDEVTDILKKREEPLIGELNAIIKQKFEEMFNEKEKYAQMEDDYKLHLYYHKLGNDGMKIEEFNLSEGEIIARNFVFIVSILELAQKKKKEDNETLKQSDVLNLPLVLDGPFSKLSDKNIGLVAGVLPEAAEQVIIFMLDKDWTASGLEKYTLPDYKYEVEKEPEENSARIVRK